IDFNEYLLAVAAASQGDLDDRLDVAFDIIDQQQQQQQQSWATKSVLQESPTGKLNKKQFVEAYKRFYPGAKADTYCQLAFSVFDANNDGTIDFNEYLLAVAAASQGDLDDRLDVAFDICDTSDDGQINQKELATMITAAYDLRGETDRKGDHDPKKRAAEIISRLDIGGDKKLSKAEFITG
ncbi:unnamed protein product, partial [Rotaria sordida]